jgi:hypothetical protein
MATGMPRVGGTGRAHFTSGGEGASCGRATEPIARSDARQAAPDLPMFS